MKVVLASSSPRRSELMKFLEMPFEVVVRETNEKIMYSSNPYIQCMSVAKEKAQVVFEEIKGDVVVIGGDTMVLYQNKIYGKPQNHEDAYQMIEEFCNHQHEVISSICVLIRKDGKTYEEMDYDKCEVFVDNMTSSEINDWINNHDVYTRAGAYAIQDGFGKYIKEIKGDYFSIVGLPVHKLYAILKKYNIFDLK